MQVDSDRNRRFPRMQGGSRKSLSSISFLALFMFFGWLGASYGQSSSAQSKKSKSDDSQLRYGKPSVQKWEMGVEVEGTGDTKGITALFPIPIDWPEQKIKIVTQNKTKNVGRIQTRFVNREKTCKIAVVTIPLLRANQTARATIVFEVSKAHTLEPKDASVFKVAKNTQRLRSSYLGVSPYIETTHPRIRQIADSLAAKSYDSDWEKVEAVFDWVRSNVEYEFDETIRTCETALNSGKGDCEELSSIFIALCRAQGIPARAIWIPGHTYPEFYLVDQDKKGHWIPCQVAGGNNDFGRMPEDKPILQKGDKFRLPGHKSLQRYARPTLSARSATSAPRLKWIVEKLEE